MSTLPKYRIRLSSKKELVERVRADIKKNGGYCPLDTGHSRKCICKEFLEQDGEGACKCELYIKELQYD